MVRNISLTFLVLLLHANNAIIGETIKPKIAIVVSVYHESIAEKLLEGATGCLYKNGLGPEDISIAYIPGAFEIPFTAKLLAATKRFDAIICLGAIQTSNNLHWSYLTDHVCKNIADVSLTFDIPVAYGIFLFSSKEEGQELANSVEKNRGWEAAQAAVTMIGLVKQIKRFAATEAE